jgi:uncharacterized delta-60 repeat protein
VDFGGDDFGLALARQANGRILVAGRSTAAGAVVARLRSNGALDPDFDGDGRVTLPGGGSVNAILVQLDRNILVAGNAAGNLAMTVTRLTPNGSPDATFGVGGKATVDFGAATFGFAVALAPSKRIVVAGQRTGNDDFAVARLVGRPPLRG